MGIMTTLSENTMHGMDGTSVRSGDTEIVVRRKTDSQNTLYEVESGSGGARITVNSSSRMFEAFRNPLLLLGLIKIEAEVFGRMGASKQAVAERNRLWNEFVDAFLPAEKAPVTKRLGPRQEPVPLPHYTLQPELVDLHDHLREVFPHRFQFTGLSTLAPFLHNAHHTLAYNIQAEAGTGQELLEAITCHDKDHAVLLDPRPELLFAYIERAGDPFVLVIREHSERLAYTLASPEKAWLDLSIETENGAAPYEGEMVYILDDLLERGLVRPPRLASLAKRRGPKISDRVGKFLPG